MSNYAWRTCSPLTWREYHQATKHSAESLWRSPHVLDWDSMPHPFRYYEGAPTFDLPADPPGPEIPALAVLQRRIAGPSGCAGGAQFLSRLLFHSAAISATKRVPSTGYQYSLRVNPRSMTNGAVMAPARASVNLKSTTKASATIAMSRVRKSENAATAVSKTRLSGTIF